MKEASLYQLALSHIDGVGHTYAKNLVRHFGDAKTIFSCSKRDLLQAKISSSCADSILAFSDWSKLEKELNFLEKNKVKLLFFTDKDYPDRLRALSDCPPLLFYNGNTDLNATKTVAIIGTRTSDDYGKQITEHLVRQLAQPDILVISGLAYGIDAHAHAAAIKYNVPTLGVLGHGLAHIYPHEHKPLAKDILHNGGLLTSFEWNAGPETYHFPQRNKIVAGLSDAVIVVQTGRKGGSMLTAQYAQSFGRKIFAVPGRLSDARSAGCNELIRQGKAELLFSGDQVQASMGWKWPNSSNVAQASLPFLQQENHLPEEEQTLLRLLKETKDLSIDELSLQCQRNSTEVSLNLLNLELKGMVTPLPGRRYQLS